MASKYNVGGDIRIISVIDMDSFEVQLWQKLTNNCTGGSLKNHPPTVVADLTQRILAVNPQAKRFGIKRSKDKRMTVQDAIRMYQDVRIIYKPDSWGKPSTKEVRDASFNNLVCVKAFLKENNLLQHVTVEYKSGDEIFLDLTKAVENLKELEYEYYKVISKRHPNLFYESTVLCKNIDDFIKCKESRFKTERADFPLVCPSLKPDQIADQAKLMYAGEIMVDLLKFMEIKTGFKASAGVSFNKNLAKIACNLHKPESCTILMKSGYERLQHADELDGMLFIDQVPGIGKSLRNKILETFGKQYVELGWLHIIPRVILVEALGDEDGNKVYKIGKGTYVQPVVSKQMTNRINCRKNNVHLRKISDLRGAIQNLAGEMRERVMEEIIRNRRAAKILSITLEFYNLDAFNVKLQYADRGDLDEITDNILDCILASGFIQLGEVQRIALTVREFYSLSPYTEKEFYQGFRIRNYNI